MWSTAVPLSILDIISLGTCSILLPQVSTYESSIISIRFPAYCY